jgi:uncharacterized protein (DUF488 family)
MPPAPTTPLTLWTIGHSNREQPDFLQLLAGQSVTALADVRRFPGSRRYPHFNQAALSIALAEAGIEYHHFPDLGGRRSARKPDSENNAWRVEAFNAYADYMTSSEFAEAFDSLASIAVDKRTAIMCAEALPWRCHRRLIADVFLARGWTVLDIISPTQTKPHALPEFARVENGMVKYPAKTLF